MTKPVNSPQTTNPKHVVAVYIILAFALSSIFWFIIVEKPPIVLDFGIAPYVGFLLMWCPAFAAIVTRLSFQRNLSGFGFKPGEIRWWLVAILIPIVVGAIMFGTAWIFDIEPFLPERAFAMLTLPGLLALLMGLGLSIASATGEEIGWRGLLVPELGRFCTFTWVALISALVWGCWHLPLMIFGSYHGSGALWYSIITFFLALFGGSTIFAWIRLRSGSVWPAALLHGFWNYFIQKFYPALTEATEAGAAMVGEFGWYTVLISVILGLLFWHLRDRLPHMPRPEGGL